MGEIGAVAGDAGRSGLGSTDLAQGPSQALSIAFAVDRTAELAVPEEAKWSDLLTAI
jgi:hypothetical protein